MESTTKRRSVLARTVIATGAAGALVATLGTAGWATLSSSAAYPKGNLTKAQITLAAKYTGGTANHAASGAPVTIGFINDDAGVVPYPENWAGAQLAQWFVNNDLGGIKGHPVSFDHCSANDDASTALCATQMVNDHVKLVLTGTVLNNNSQMYKTLALAHIPVIIGNGLTTADFGPPGGGTAVTYMPGSPGVVQGLAKFVGKGGTGAKPKSVAVVYTNDPGATTAYNSLFKPSKYLTGVTIHGVSISPNATSSQVQSAIIASHASTDSVFVPLVPVQACISIYDALKTLNIKTKVVTTGLCFGTPLIQHLGGSFPPGWYFGDYGVNYFIYKSTLAPSAQLAVYIAAVHQHNPTMQYTGFAGPSFGNVLTAVKLYNTIGVAATSAQLAPKVQGFKGPQWGISGPMKCGFWLFGKAVCGQFMGVAQYKSKAAGWVPIQDAYNNKLINGFN
jgi:hypothetical protein